MAPDDPSVHHHYGKTRPRAPLIATAEKRRRPHRRCPEFVSRRLRLLSSSPFSAVSSSPFSSLGHLADRGPPSASQFKCLMPVFVVVFDGDKGKSSFIIKAMKYALLSISLLHPPDATPREPFPSSSSSCSSSLHYRIGRRRNRDPIVTTV